MRGVGHVGELIVVRLVRRVAPGLFFHAEHAVDDAVDQVGLPRLNAPIAPDLVLHFRRELLAHVVEGMGAVGAPYYVNAYPIDEGNRGYYIEMQSNPVMVCTRPAAVLTIGLS